MGIQNMEKHNNILSNVNTKINATNINFTEDMNENNSIAVAKQL